MSTNNIYIHYPRKRFPHIWHALLTLLTCGLWFPVWGCVWAFWAVFCKD